MSTCHFYRSQNHMCFLFEVCFCPLMIAFTFHCIVLLAIAFHQPTGGGGVGGRKKEKGKKSTAAWQMLVQMSDAYVINGYSLWSYKYKIMSTSCNDKTAHEIFQCMFNSQGNFWFELPINFLLGWNDFSYRRTIVYAVGFFSNFCHSLHIGNSD